MDTNFFHNIITLDSQLSDLLQPYPKCGETQLELVQLRQGKRRNWSCV